jgi:hypothetical protein
MINQEFQKKSNNIKAADFLNTMNLSNTKKRWQIANTKMEIY